MRKLVFATAAAAVGLGLPVATAAAASADAADDNQPLVTVINGACVAPWLWQLPVVTVVTGPENYANCDAPAVPHEHGALAGVLDDSCVLPWDWEGPLDIGDAVLHPMSTGHYAGCDHAGEAPTGMQAPQSSDDDLGLDLVN